MFAVSCALTIQVLCESLSQCWITIRDLRPDDVFLLDTVSDYVLDFPVERLARIF